MAKAATKTKRASAPVPPAAANPEVAKVIEAFLADPELAPIAVAFVETKDAGQGRKFGSNGLKVNGKLFALFTQGTLVVKLPKARVAALIDEKVGRPFDPGHGRLMKEWLSIVSTTASWAALAKEAHDYVKGAQ
jgi:hypothetical protein